MLLSFLGLLVYLGGLSSFTPLGDFYLGSAFWYGCGGPWVWKLFWSFLPKEYEASCWSSDAYCGLTGSLAGALGSEYLTGIGSLFFSMSCCGGPGLIGDLDFLVCLVGVGTYYCGVPIGCRGGYAYCGV